MGSSRVLCRGGMVQRNSDHYPLGDCTVGAMPELAEQPGTTCPPPRWTGFAYPDHPAGGLVRVLSPPDRVSAGQSGIPALQRDLDALAATHPVGPGASHPATHRPHEHVRACAVHAGGNAPTALAGTRRNATAAHLTAG